jgi:nucleotide-binding universal stress UspA family protein
VIGIKKRRPIGKALLGSISQRLLLEAEIPILAVKVG